MQKWVYFMEIDYVSSVKEHIEGSIRIENMVFSALLDTQFVDTARKEQVQELYKMSLAYRAQ